MPPFTTTLRVRYAETDQMGVAYYANYFIWCEIGRVELLRQLGFDYKQMEIMHNCHLPVVEASCRYKSPARYDDLITIETRISGLRTSVIKFSYRIFCSREGAAEPVLLADAETVHVSVDRNMRKCPLPEPYLSAIRAASTTDCEMQAGGSAKHSCKIQVCSSCRRAIASKPGRTATGGL